MKPNIPLLLQIKQLILDEPGRMNMSRWADSGSEQPPCNTVGCIAGWSIALANNLRGKDFYSYMADLPDFVDSGNDQNDIDLWGRPFPVAREILGLTREQATRLFIPRHWDKPFVYEWEELKDEPTTPIYSALVARYIDHFISTLDTSAAPEVK